jgi:hypothetical protein
VAGVGVCIQVGNGPALWGAVARACANGHRKVHTFDNSFPSRLCAKLAPMMRWRRSERRQSVLVELEWLRRVEDPGYIRQG